MVLSTTFQTTAAAIINSKLMIFILHTVCCILLLSILAEVIPVSVDFVYWKLQEEWNTLTKATNTTYFKDIKGQASYAIRKLVRLSRSRELGDPVRLNRCAWTFEATWQCIYAKWLSTLRRESVVRCRSRCTYSLYHSVPMLFIHRSSRGEASLWQSFPRSLREKTLVFIRLLANYACVSRKRRIN